VLEHMASNDQIEIPLGEVELHLLNVAGEDGVNLRISSCNRGDFRHEFHSGHEFRRVLVFQKK